MDTVSEHRNGFDCVHRVFDTTKYSVCSSLPFAGTSPIAKCGSRSHHGPVVLRLASKRAPNSSGLASNPASSSTLSRIVAQDQMMKLFGQTTSQFSTRYSAMGPPTESKGQRSVSSTGFPTPFVLFKSTDDPTAVSTKAADYIRELKSNMIL